MHCLTCVVLAASHISRLNKSICQAQRLVEQRLHFRTDLICEDVYVFCLVFLEFLQMLSELKRFCETYVGEARLWMRLPAKRARCFA